MSGKNVLIVSSNGLFREGLKHVLADTINLAQTAQVSTLQEAEELMRMGEVDVVIYVLADKVQGQEYRAKTITSLLSRPGVRVIVVSMNATDEKMGIALAIMGKARARANATNNGNVTDSFDLTATGQTWYSALSTALVSLAPSASEVFTVTVTIPPGTADQESDTVTIMATSQGDSSQTDSATLTTTAVSTPIYGVSLSPDDSLSGPAGGQVIYTVTVSNSGSVVDSFDLLPSGNSWTTTLSSQVVTLGAGSSQAVTITVLIPPAAAALASDQVSIQATSRHDSSKQDTAVLTTVSTGQPARIHLPMVISNVVHKAGLWGGGRDEGQ